MVQTVSENLAMKKVKNPFQPCLIVMAKYPQDGKVKTRLSPFLSSSQAAQLAMCFLKDTLNKVEKLDTNLIVAYSPPESFSHFSKIVGKSAILIEQAGDNLGERINNALKSAFERNFSPVIMIGTDSPTFPPSEIEKALKLLNETECVWGAAQDGGFYFVGLNKFLSGIFKNVEWSSSRTLADCLQNARLILGNEPKFVGDWFDVDVPEFLKALYDEILKNADFAELAPETAKWLKENERLFE